MATVTMARTDLLGLRRVGALERDRWVGRVLDGGAPAEQVQEFALRLAHLYDQSLRLYGPMYMVSADYRVRRIFVDKLLRPVALRDGTHLRVGEGAHCELAREVALGLGASREAIEASEHAGTPPEIAIAIDRLVHTLQRPPYWIGLAVSALAESTTTSLNPRFGDALAAHYGVDPSYLALFRQPGLFDETDLEPATVRPVDEMIRERLSYYAERVQDEWIDAWRTCIPAT